MLDFDRLVNVPIAKVFGTAPTYTPVVSQPGVAAFAITGVFDRRNELIEAEEVAHSSAQVTLSVRRSLFTAEPAQNDLVTVPNEGNFRVFDPLADPVDGGLIVLVLKVV